MSYDDWKLATPPEYDELPYGPPEEEEPEEKRAPQNPRTP